MSEAPSNALIRKLERRDHLTIEEREMLASAIDRTLTVAAGEDMIEEGDRPWVSTLLLDGLAARYKFMGKRKRQISALHIAGDFVDLHGFLLKRMDHGIVALSACRIATVPHDNLIHISETQPHLTRMLWLSTVIDAAIHRQRIATMGGLRALGQLAHLLCEMFVRLRAVELTKGDSFEFPLKQKQLAEVLGTSAVHANRVLKDLRETGYVRWNAGTVTISDWNRLAELANFDPLYLNLEMEPR